MSSAVKRLKIGVVIILFFLLVSFPPGRIFNIYKNLTKRAKEINRKETIVAIVSVGDIFIHKSVLDASYRSEDKTYDFNGCFEPIADDLREADLATAWFGGVLSASGPYTGYPLFKTPEALAQAMKETGFDIVFRTNHTMDYGEKGLLTTTHILRKYGIEQIGAYASEEASRKIFVYKKDSLRVAFLGYIYGMNGLPIPKSWMVNLIDTTKIREDIERAKGISDFVIVALHFGREYERYPDEEQKRIARKTAEYGADLIIGSHPHVIQPVEVLTLSNGKKVYVAYSLGNFFCGQRMRFTDTGIILKYKIAKAEGRVLLKEINYLPVWIAKYQEKGKYQFKILPIRKALEIYERGGLEYLKEKDYKRMKEAHEETIKHIDNLEIGFVEAD